MTQPVSPLAQLATTSSIEPETSESTEPLTSCVAVSPLASTGIQVPSAAKGTHPRASSQVADASKEASLLSYSSKTSTAEPESTTVGSAVSSCEDLQPAMLSATAVTPVATAAPFRKVLRVTVRRTARRIPPPAWGDGGTLDPM